jgi:hypothetical protein
VITVAIGDRDEPGKYTSWNFFDNYVVSTTEDSNCLQPNKSDVTSIPNSNAFIDFDGDCMPDLFLTRTNSAGQSYYEIYIQMMIISSLGERTQKYCLVDSQGGALTSSTNTEMPLVDMVDMNRDGMVDLVFVDSETNKLQVLYNQQTMQEKDDNKNIALCRDSQFSNFSTPFFPVYPFNDITKSISFDLASNTLTGAPSGTFTGLAKTDTKNPGRARMVDINVDSFPDVVITGEYSHAGTSSV